MLADKYDGNMLADKYDGNMTTFFLERKHTRKCKKRHPRSMPMVDYDAFVSSIKRFVVVHTSFFSRRKHVYAARHTGCGVQIRPRPIPASPSTPLPHSEHVTPLHPMSAETELPAYGGINPYFPTLLSDIVVFFGAGLCWGLEKTNSAANLPMVAGDVPRGVRAALGRGRFESTSGRGANGAAMGTDVQTLHGSPRPALFLVEHVLEIDSGTIPPASMSQVSGIRCQVFFNKR